MKPMSRALACLLAALLMAACTRPRPGLPTLPPLPAHTAAIQATATSLPSPTPTPEWAPVPGGENLVNSDSWACVPGVTPADGRLVIAAGHDSVTIVNEFGPHLEAAGDFGLAATVEATTRRFAGITLFGALGQGEWWQGVKRLDLGTEAGQVIVAMWEGNSPEPTIRQEFPAAGLAGKHQLGIRKTGEVFTLLAQGQPLGQVADPGLFTAGIIYLGANVAPGNELTIYALAAEAEEGQGVAVGEKPFWAATAAPIPKDALRALAQRRGLLIGAAAAPGPLVQEALYAETLGREFNALTPENVMKFEAVEPSRGRYTFCEADQLVAFAQAHQMQVRGHTLVWHESLPAWLTGSPFTREELMAILRDHIYAVAGHYRGQLLAWDVVNEAIDNQGQLRDSIWLRGIGPEYIDLAFHWAHEADPHALLFYNDYGGEGLGRKSDAIYELVKGLTQRGVPLDGVGLQMHVGLAEAPPAEEVAANMERLAELGLIVHVTEMDVRLGGLGTPAELDAQARLYGDMLRTCLSASNCQAFVLWGFTDRYTWIPDLLGRPDAPLIFDRDYRPKPAYGALQQALAGERAGE